MMLDRIDTVTAQIATLTGTIEQAIAPFAAQATQLDAITGIGPTATQELIAELGVDMSCFPTADHLVAWAKFCPQTRQSAGKTRAATTGKGNPWLAATLGEIAIVAARTDTFLGARYHRIAKRRALVAVGNSVLTIVWHLLSDPDASYHDLGADFYQTHLNRERRTRTLVRQLERLGHTVTLQPAA
jgi:transposase